MCGSAEVIYTVARMWEIFIYDLSQRLQGVGELLGSWLDKHLVNIIAILVGAWLVRRFGAGLINRALSHTIRADLYPTKIDREKRLRTLDSLVNAGMRVGIYIVAAILLVGEINPAYTTALFASAGFIGVALGFGAQSLIKDFVSGIFIITENQYRVGDIVDLGGVSGTVEDVTIRTTVLRDLDGNLHHVPNGTITITTNKTIGFSRINEDIVVAMDTDVDRLEHVINHVGQELAARPDFKHIIDEPPHFASFKGFAGSGIVIKILGKTSAADQWHVRSEMYKMLKKAFDKNNIELATLPPLLPLPKK